MSELTEADKERLMRRAVYEIGNILHKNGKSFADLTKAERLELIDIFIAGASFMFNIAKEVHDNS